MIDLLIPILCFAIGLCIGAVMYRQFKSDTAKVEMLEQKIQSLQSEHDNYKGSVHSHFNTTAQLVNNLTDSYREVYRQLASSAQELCPESISSQLSLSSRAYDLLSTKDDAEPRQDNTTPSSSSDPLFPPKDYSPKATPNQKGNLAEGYGLNKAPEEPQS